MFSHIVIFWTDLNNPKGDDELIAGAEKYLKDIPGVVNFHIGKMVPSLRPVVNQTYQVALNIQFPTRKDLDVYQAHPLHHEFLEKVFRPIVKKVAVYDFE